MKEQQILHGFRVTRVRELPEIGAVMNEMVYERNGAQLIYLDRQDSNKTFAIAFKTIPEDSTGVFHIIEHSVLCGSRKYPTKDPFVELLKGSLQTFLNAFTFPDKTMYPVSSRNERDFLNLVDVYMDAVLHPQILDKPEIFYQEGWHYEYTGEGEPTYKGVVFNEMKGAYSSVDGLAEERLSALMFPDNCYGKDSGGDPVHIPELTYEKFVACHAKYYHPSNARIFLDGTMDLDAVLQKLDGFLSPYGPLAVDTEIPAQRALGEVVADDEYELAEGEDEHGKIRLYLGYRGFPFHAQREALALSVLSSVLCGSNEAPLKRALLERGLCEELSLVHSDGIEESYVVIDVQNVAEENLAEVKRTVREVMEATVRDGLDARRMTAALNRLEFRLRERDFGRFPRGLVYAMSSLETWLYGGDPAQNLSYDASLAFLREHLTDGYFEELLRRLFLENPHRAVLTLRPSKTLAERRLAAERDRLHRAFLAMTEDERAELAELGRRLVAWQSTPDTPEAIATLPTLSLSDITREPVRVPREECVVDGVTVLSHEVATEGISYVGMFFNVADATAEELPALALLSQLFTQTATDRHDVLSLQDHIKENLGYLSMTPLAASVGTDAAGAKVFLQVSAGVLNTNKGALPEILSELFSSMHLDDRAQVLKIVRQIKMAGEEMLLSAGHAVGMGRVQAALTSMGAVAEYTKGVAFHEWIKALEADFDSRADGLLALMRRLLRRSLTKERLLLSLTGPFDAAFAADLIATVPSDGVTPPTRTAILPMGPVREGLRIPSQSSYAVIGGKLERHTGAASVAEGIVSYEYLWNRIRVQGGAYGAGQAVRRGGFTFCYSYRDPDAAHSLAVFDGLPAFLRDFAKSGEPIDKYIIGAVGSSEPLLSPRALGELGCAEYINEVSYEDACRVRREMLATTAEELLTLADALERAYRDGAVCVVGSREKLDACATRLDSVRDI